MAAAVGRPLEPQLELEQSSQLPPAPRPVGWFQFGPVPARRPVASFRFGPVQARRLEAPQTHCCLSLVLTCTRPAPGSELTRLMRVLISLESSSCGFTSLSHFV